MEPHMSKERRIISEKKQSSLGEAEVAKDTFKLELEAHRAAEKKNSKPWYFTHS
jgi:hypothetical protein